ncbi:uncharacterized protein MYCGRDRAFT_51670 [Zymoseptoria tritici IPO323]|uniref:ubiquitinyl hydrolase 1 n=2 Tax=Zymoseptoria tritici TaxID=1047171 RepID=F9XQP2_ZYMTI|nr:uncharacterized protein MYCGRDRAFT_51670 [Zymoseptoria tritici IPO323]EGP82392.1 hypothetical protein MYCGRDRAFT_51670 [Zymoseptoria tritici IPO323]
MALGIPRSDLWFTEDFFAIYNNFIEFIMLSRDAFLFLVHHVFLPPKLPQKNDSGSGFELILLNFVIEALTAFRKLSTDQELCMIDAAMSMLLEMKSVHASPADEIIEDELQRALGTVVDHGGFLPLHVRAQNAGVIISKVDAYIHFEAFELAPLNEAVLTTTGRLRRHFPGSATAVKVSQAAELEFQAVVARTLSLMSHQAAAGLQPQAKKAGQMHDEDRETTHPGMVSEFFDGFVTAVGTPVSVEVLAKNTREEVLWDKARSPWRRSPGWLLLRVSLQLCFSRSAKEAGEYTGLYKQFMVFLMSRVLKTSTQFCLDTDVLHIMNAKIARRLHKLNPNLCTLVQDAVLEVMRETHELISNRWSSIQDHEKHSIDLSTLSTLDFERDIQLSLPELDDFIEATKRRKSQAYNFFVHMKSDLIIYDAHVLPEALGVSGDTTVQNLHGFETWMGSNLSDWVQEHKNDFGACGQLGALMKRYHSLAMVHYSANPEAISMMVLVTLELWVACDKIATRSCSLLDKYDPGIPEELLQNLLLPLRQQMDRLSSVENYLMERSQSRRPSTMLFSNSDDECFAARYFDQSATHQALHQRILEKATKARSNKIDELRRLQEDYARLMRLHSQSCCEFYEFSNHISGLQKHHSPNCLHCSYSSKANALEIAVHEWPLPEDITRAKSVVFELSVPTSFGHWRDATVYLLLDVLAAQYSSTQRPRTSHRLSQDPHLTGSFSSSFDPAGSQRIELLSQNKPHTGTHRRGRNVSTAREHDVCVHNGLNYQYYDNGTGCFTCPFEVTDKLPRSCTYSPPSRSLALEKYIFRPAQLPNGPSPNTVIAGQSECPAHMTLHEFKELTSIPLAYHVQWIEIAVQLTLPSIDFKKPETALVLLQCIHQAGPMCDRNGTLRESHQLLGYNEFADTLLNGLNDALHRIEQNWESSQALAIFIAIARRLCSLSCSESVQAACLQYLQKASTVALNWAHLLKSKANQTNAIDREEFLLRSVEAALLCSNTFDVDRAHLPAILANAQVASVLLQCSTMIHDGNHALADTIDLQTMMSKSRHMRILHDAYHCLATNQAALHDAIGKAWSAYRPQGDWHASDSACHWVVTRTAPMAQDGGLSVQYNLLSGQLLVNGLPLDRLPANYEQCEGYQSLFGKSTVEVMPSSVPGMQFSSKTEHHGYNIHFGLSTLELQRSKDFMVQTSTTTSGTTHELIPKRFFHKQLPESFVNDFVHWYDCGTEQVEFRPTAKPWSNGSREQWTLVRSDDSKWRLTMPRNKTFLIGLNSQTATILANLLSPLAKPLQIHCVVSAPLSSLDIKVPSLRLAFNLDRGASFIRCLEFRGMIVDPDQSLGTLIGFQNKLILRSEHTGDRIILLVEGNTSFRTRRAESSTGQWSSRHHVVVEVDRDTTIRWHSFRVDLCLNRLIDNGGLQSKLFLVYLHALTSSCAQDPLTKMTGTEQALGILGSAAVRSFDQLSQENIDLLMLIAGLTPKRSYYPANEQVMQTITWDSQLGFMAQHNRFYQLVQSILRQAARSKLFFPGSKVEIPTVGDVEPLLLERDCIRSSAWRVSDYGAEDHTSEGDIAYHSRDRNGNSPRRLDVYVISSLIHHGHAKFHWGPLSEGSLWEFLSRASMISGPEYKPDLSQIRYDATLLEDNGTFLSENWPPLQRILSRGPSGEINKYALMIWLSTMACSGKIEKAILETVALIYTCDDFGAIIAPNEEAFHIYEGRHIDKAKLKEDIKPNLRAFHHSPEAKLSKLLHESRVDFGHRTQQLFRSSQQTAVEKLASALITQWPSENPNIPAIGQFADVSSYVDVQAAMRTASTTFKNCFDNLQLSQYLQLIEGIASHHEVHPVTVPRQNLQDPLPSPGSNVFISTADIFEKSAPRLTIACEPIKTSLRPLRQDRRCSRLEEFITRLEMGKDNSGFENDYVNNLKASLESLRHLERQEVGQLPSHDCLVTHLQSCRSQALHMYGEMTRAATPSASESPSLAAMAEIDQWPRMRPMLYLQQLGKDGWKGLVYDWRRCIVTYGLALTWAQRAERLVNASRSGRKSDVVAELQNTGHQNWDALEHPESLLLEVECNIMIRDVQEQIAGEMRNPRCRRNTSMQLNMGEGKSSVIVPMVAAALADGSRLVRVIVGKPQAKQMAQMLISKLGGMLNRRIYYLPVSRSLRLDGRGADTIDQICRECKKNGGILLVHPEHILSFQLMGLERHITGDESVGRPLLRTQELFDQCSRDIVDESDENFSVKFELIYTIGTQRQIDMSPDRWISIQQVLDLVNEIAPTVADELPHSLEIRRTSRGQFPRMRILHLDAVEPLLDKIGKKICATGLAGFPIYRQPPAVRDAVLSYITKRDITSEQIDLVENSAPDGFWNESNQRMLFLLRGLLAEGVLGFAFGRKRWRVNYGFDPSRTPTTRLAVPFRAKDQPTSRSEFSHPDVVILLTSLCYYYGGLADEHLFASFEHLLDTDQKDIEYQAWIQGVPDLCRTFRQLEGINLKDRQQCTSHVFPALRHNKRVVDYFLSHIVFPKEMREFPSKLSA